MSNTLSSTSAICQCCVRYVLIISLLTVWRTEHVMAAASTTIYAYGHSHWQDTTIVPAQAVRRLVPKPTCFSLVSKQSNASAHQQRAVGADYQLHNRPKLGRSRHCLYHAEAEDTADHAADPTLDHQHDNLISPNPTSQALERQPPARIRTPIRTQLGHAYKPYRTSSIASSSSRTSATNTFPDGFEAHEFSVAVSFARPKRRSPRSRSSKADVFKATLELVPGDAAGYDTLPLKKETGNMR